MDEDVYSVYPRYKDLKEEMLNYQHLDHESYENVLAKAKIYVQTNIAKSLKIYSIDAAAPISINNLICIILYCDYSNLSSDFTRSFRKIHQFEVLSHIKQRNSYYYHFSKILKETITIYGQRNFFGGNGLLPVLKGPFYCGMSVVLNISQFNMKLLSPTSTSVELSVAIKFSGNNGMILELNNVDGQSQEVMGMDCSWISRYKEEDERYQKLYLHLYFIIQYITNTHLYIDCFSDILSLFPSLQSVLLRHPPIMKI